MTPPCILIACIGNIFLGDDAFGVEVSRELTRLSWPPGVRVEDFGIRGVDLAYTLLEGYDVTLFVDAAPRGNTPGTLVLIEPDLAEIAQTPAGAAIDGHSMDPATVLRTAVSLSARLPRVLVLGCEPTPPAEDDSDMQMELSPAVRAAVSRAVPMIRELIERLLSEAAEPSQNLSGAAQENSSCLPQ